MVLTFGFTERRAARRYVIDGCVLPREGSTIRLLSGVYCPVNFSSVFLDLRPSV